LIKKHVNEEREISEQTAALSLPAREASATQLLNLKIKCEEETKDVAEIPELAIKEARRFQLHPWPLLQT
jgi:hypothetical protein